tara:strand:- start:624 stop:1127 length:504 start_codon:yes stop_codon:yes gene_type:complete
MTLTERVISSNMIVDVLNVVCEKEDSKKNLAQFNYDSFVELIKNIEETYDEDFIYCMPEYLLYKKHLKKIQSEDTVDCLMRNVKSKKIILCQNDKESDDKSMIYIALAKEGRILSKDKKLIKHLDKLPLVEKTDAMQFIEENIMDFHFVDGEIVIIGLIPKKFKRNT